MTYINYGAPEPPRTTCWRCYGSDDVFMWHQALGGWSWSGTVGVGWRHIHPSCFPMQEVAA